MFQSAWINLQNFVKNGTTKNYNRPEVIAEIKRMERGNCVRGLHYGEYTAAHIGNKWFFENSVGLFEKFEITAYLLRRPPLITRKGREGGRMNEHVSRAISDIYYTYCLDNIRSFATCFLIKWDRGMYFKENASWHGYTIQGHHTQKIYIV